MSTWGAIWISKKYERLTSGSEELRMAAMRRVTLLRALSVAPLNELT